MFAAANGIIFRR